MGLRVHRLGTTSITWEVGVFERGSEEVRCVGDFTHVCVERSTGVTAKGGMPLEVRAGLERLVVEEGKGEKEQEEKGEVKAKL